MSTTEERLIRMERKLDAIMENLGIEEDGPLCASCGSSDIEDTTDFGEKSDRLAAQRLTCRGCGISWLPGAIYHREEAVTNG